VTTYMGPNGGLNKSVKAGRLSLFLRGFDYTKLGRPWFFLSRARLGVNRINHSATLEPIMYLA
jgi:hypothetical protein